MPELPEVETIARGLAGLVGRTISRVRQGPHDWVRHAPPSASAHLVGRKLAAVRRHGKQLGLRLEPAGELRVHLGMSGQVTLSPSGDPVKPHTHLRLSFAGLDQELRFRDARRFGGAWILGDEASPAPPATPGPDALQVDLRRFRRLLRRNRQIKALLLDQRTISGVGNIYGDEALFAARIHPQAVAGRLEPDRVRLLHRSLGRVLRSAIRHGGSTVRDYRDADGQGGRFQIRHRVYGREGLPCPRCGATIVRIIAAGRSSHVCRRCQRRPRASAGAGVTRRAVRSRGSAPARPRR